MYTEVFFRAELKKETPPDVINLIRAWTEGGADLMDVPDHEFFKCDRWTSLPIGGSAYFPTGSGPLFARSEWGGYWALIFHSSLKNYDGEAEKFFDWIERYTLAGVGEFLGFTLYEEDDLPKLHYRKRLE